MLHSQPHQGDERLKRAGRFLLHPNGYAGPKQPDLGGGGGGGEGGDFRKIVYKAALFFSFNQKGNSFRHRLDHEFSLSNFLTIRDEEKN